LPNEAIFQRHAAFAVEVGRNIDDHHRAPDRRPWPAHGGEGFFSGMVGPIMPATRDRPANPPTKRLEGLVAAVTPAAESLVECGAKRKRYRPILALIAPRKHQGAPRASSDRSKQVLSEGNDLAHQGGKKVAPSMASDRFDGTPAAFFGQLPHRQEKNRKKIPS